MSTSFAVANAADVRQAERHWAATKASGTWPLMVMAANSFVRQYVTELRKGRVLVLAGTGNNGGDGYYIGKLLLEAGVKTSLYAPFGLPSEDIDAHRAYRAFLAAGGQVLKHWPEQRVDALVDALFGSGLNRPLQTDAQVIIERINQAQLPVFAVDVPSGLNADTGLALPIAVQASATHSFIAFKPGLLTAQGPSLTGRLTLDTLEVTTHATWCYQPNLAALPQRLGATHKAQHGNVRIIGGREHMAGAAILAGSAALNAGAGRVFVHCDERYFAAVISQAPELMLGQQLSLPDLHQDVLVVGPGLGRQPETGAWLASLLADKSLSGVLDADALYWLASMAQADCRRWILTPHEGEAAALLGIHSDAVLSNRPQAALQLSERYQCPVVLKGAGTIVADQGVLVFCHPGTPKMATPGMGDVLAGIIGALMAQGLTAVEAAIAGVNWHAHCAVLIARQQRLVLASDVVQALKLTL